MIEWMKLPKCGFLVKTYKLCTRCLFPSLPSRPLGCAEADAVLKKCERVLEVLDQHDEELFSKWTEGLEEICQTHLKEPLLTLDTDTGLFQVNFSPVVSTKTMHHQETH